VVLYLRSADFRDASSILGQVARTLRPHAFDAVPAFTKSIARGVALAEDPGPGLSFGEHRCGLVAAGLIQAFEAGRRDFAGRLEAVEAQFNAAGIDLDSPYLSPGSIDVYDFSPPAPAGTARQRTRPGQAGAEHVAEEIGGELCRRATWYEGRCTWLGPPPESEPGRRLESLGFDLYAGTSGIGLFLAELAAATNNAETRRTALGALQQALTRASEAPKTSTSLYDGHTGVAVAAARAGILLGHASLVDAARSLALQQDRRRPDEDGPDDLLSGRAGAVLGLILLSKLLDDHALVTPALRLAEELVERSRPGPRGRSWRSPLFRDSVDQTGMSHGAAGIALALVVASAACGDDRLRLAAEETFDYEWSWFDADAQNWADLRGVRRGQRGDLLAYSTDWCHGAPGIALSRLAAHRAFGGERWKREASLGLDTTLSRVARSLETGFDAVDACLCHGPLSCGEVLLTGGAYLDDARYRATALDLAAAAASAWQSAEQTWRAQSSPGLMSGMAGLGYFLLRASGRRTPSLLLPLAEDFMAYPAGHPDMDKRRGRD
jgi:lantibiotic modifying enzyme